MKIKKSLRLPVILLSAVLIINILLQLLCVYFIHEAFRPLKPIYAPDSPSFVKEHRPVYQGDDKVELLNQAEKERCYPVLKSISQKVSITSFDGLNLNAYLAVHNTQNHKYAIIMHGFRDSPKNISPYALHFYEHGFNILAPGQRGHGWSEGNFIDMSAFTPFDVLSWINYICQKDSEAKITLWGVSMGGSTVMRATGLELPSNVVCCIEDCGFSSAWDEYIYQMNTSYKLPGKVLLPYFNLYIKRKFDFDCRTVSAKDDLRHSVTPTLFIHGDADDYVPFYMQDIVFNAASCVKEKLVIKGAKHARAAFTEPEKYWHTVDAFLEKYFE